MRMGNRLKTKMVHGVRTGNHSNPHVLKAAKAYSGEAGGTVDGEDARRSFSETPRTRRAFGGGVGGDMDVEGARKRGGGVKSGKGKPAPDMPTKAAPMAAMSTPEASKAPILPSPVPNELPMPTRKRGGGIKNLMKGRSKSDSFDRDLDDDDD